MTEGGILGGERLEKLMRESKERERQQSLEKAEAKERKAAEKAAAKQAKPMGQITPHALMRCIEDVQAVPINWLWPARIACGKLTILAGNPGLGKSQVTAALAGIVTTGGLWPVDGTRCPQGAVIFLSAEDDAGDTIRPRLEAVGANLRHCYILDGIRENDATGTVVERFFNLKDDMRRLYEAIRNIGNVRLIVIDPITAYMGGIDSHKNADVRALLNPMTLLAESCGAAIVGVSHLNKSNAQEAMQRVSGSLAFVASARAALVMIKDNANPARRLLLELKNNIAKDAGGLAFSIQSTDLANGIKTSRVEWEKELVTITADEAMRIDLEARNGELDKAKQLLLDLLADGPMLQSEIVLQYQGMGFSERTVNRAKNELGIKSKKSGKEGGWLWSIPKVANDEKTESCKKVGNLGNLRPNQALTSENDRVFSQGCQTLNVGNLQKTDIRATAKNGRYADADRELETTEALTL